MTRLPVILLAAGLLVVAACTSFDATDDGVGRTTPPAQPTPTQAGTDRDAALAQLCDPIQPGSLLAVAEAVEALEVSSGGLSDLSAQARVLEQNLAAVPLGPDAIGFRDAAVGAIAVLETEASDQEQRQRAVAGASESLHSLAAQLCPPPEL